MAGSSLERSQGTMVYMMLMSSEEHWTTYHHKPQCLPGLALLAVIAIIHGQELSATNGEFKLPITGLMADIPCSRRPAKLSTDAKAFVDKQMCKNTKMKNCEIKKKLAKHGITCNHTLPPSLYLDLGKRYFFPSPFQKKKRLTAG